MSTTFTNLLYHLVFSTKNREPRILENLRGRLYEYIGGILREEGGHLLAIGGMPDHIHLLVRAKSDTSVAALARVIKANSSRWIHQQFPSEAAFQWQAGYGAFSVSESQVPVVRRYIAGQEEHHARVSFRDELVALLEKHGIDFDERYLLG